MPERAGMSLEHRRVRVPRRARRAQDRSPAKGPERSPQPRPQRTRLPRVPLSSLRSSRSRLRLPKLQTSRAGALPGRVGRTEEPGSRVRVAAYEEGSGDAVQCGSALTRHFAVAQEHESLAVVLEG